MLNNELKNRAIPSLKSKEEMLNMLLNIEYGHIPEKPKSVKYTESDNLVGGYCSGKATLKKIVAEFEINNKIFSFPFMASVPNEGGPHPFFVLINFRPAVPDLYLPVEEIIDNGFAVLSFCYNDVSLDKNEFESGLAGVLFENGKREENDCGKLAMWAWASHRILDWAETQENLDMSRAAVCGHSRLGKTALLAGATDSRFALSYSNDSGCSGAAISRGKDGERKEVICRAFPHWFTEKYDALPTDETLLPFDQHFLIASISPRFVCVGSAHEDIWADPKSEMLSCVAATPTFESDGVLGFCHENRFAEIGESFFDGNIGYHLRRGPHYFGRSDWHKLIEFTKLKFKMY